MKRNKVILGVLIISMIVLVFSGCGGSGGNPTVPPTPEPSDDFVLIQVKNPESNIIFIAGEKNKDTVTILGEKNNQGDPTKITGTIYLSEQGDALCLEAGIGGLPTYILDSEGNKITFENYLNSTVDIALYDSNENLIEGPITIDVSPQDLSEIKRLYDSSGLQEKFLPWWGNFIDVQFDWALSVLAFASNNSGIIFDESGNPVDYIKPWEIEVNISDLLPEDNFTIIYEATFLSTIVDTVDDLSDYVSSIWDIIAEANENIDSVTNDNHPPVISNLAANPSSIAISQPTTIICSAYDSDGDPLAYHWTKNGGAFVGSTSGSSITWRAPSSPGIYRVYCEVTDGEGGEDSEPVNIVVKADEKEEIESICNKAVSALNDKNWNKARSYCINGSEAYNQVSELKNSIDNIENWYGPGNLNINSNINNIVVNGNYATVYGYFNSTFTAGSYFDENSGSFTGYLKKSGSSWKIYKGVIPNL